MSVSAEATPPDAGTPMTFGLLSDQAVGTIIGHIQSAAVKGAMAHVQRRMVALCADKHAWQGVLDVTGCVGRVPAWEFFRLRGLLVTWLIVGPRTCLFKRGRIIADYFPACTSLTAYQPPRAPRRHGLSPAVTYRAYNWTGSYMLSSMLDAACDSRLVRLTLRNVAVPLAEYQQFCAALFRIAPGLRVFDSCLEHDYIEGGVDSPRMAALCDALAPAAPTLEHFGAPIMGVERFGPHTEISRLVTRLANLRYLRVKCTRHRNARRSMERVCPNLSAAIGTLRCLTHLAAPNFDLDDAVAFGAILGMNSPTRVVPTSLRTIEVAHGGALVWAAQSPITIDHQGALVDLGQLSEPWRSTPVPHALMACINDAIFERIYIPARVVATGDVRAAPRRVRETYARVERHIIPRADSAHVAVNVYETTLPCALGALAMWTPPSISRLRPCSVEQP
jgi:hypothetical protein